LTTPVLFVMAEDLTKMELQVKVDEADVGTVKLGQKATFTVSTPGRAAASRRHPARRPRFDDTDNVVTYKTMPRSRQRRPQPAPGHDGNGAHRHRQSRKRPAGAQCRAALHAAGDRRTAPQGRRHRLAPDAAPAGPRAAGPATTGRAGTSVWVLRDGQPAAIAVKTGASNGRRPRSPAATLKAGMAVITETRKRSHDP
jgi:HlyD family secretion protein